MSSSSPNVYTNEENRKRNRLSDQSTTLKIDCNESFVITAFRQKIFGIERDLNGWLSLAWREDVEYEIRSKVQNPSRFHGDEEPWGFRRPDFRYENVEHGGERSGGARCGIGAP